MNEVTTPSSYTVRATGFEGPLELLLDLVESKKLFINEISLSKVTDEYLSYAKSLSGSDLSELTSFLSIAATLILIKSRSLLPGFVVTEEEEKDIKNLEDRLHLYSMIREISLDISENYGVKRVFLGTDRIMETTVFAPDPKLSADLMNFSILEVLNKVPKEEFLPEVRIRKIINIEEMISTLSDRIVNATKLSFKEWRNSLPSEDKESLKGNVIVSFLAMLELVRQGFMDAVQDDAFNDIELTKITRLEVTNE